MAMNFWEAQRRARLQTSLYLLVFTIMTFGIAVCAEWAMRTFDGIDYDPTLPYVARAFTGVTFAVAGYQYLMYHTQGGSYVAESVGAYRIDVRSQDPNERQLLNIVQEMAVAATLPMPAVYVLEADQINAFAAGLTSDNAAITVTTGSIRKLDRDELQGVIAHEFGHIYNGDMCISLRLTAMVMGFYFAFMLGLRVAQFSDFSDRRRSRNDGKGGGGNGIAIAALILFVAGAVTWLAGSILKAMVSRQREYLADACAVQFTRNPTGIANALKKIAVDGTRDMPKSGAGFSHLYFNDTSFFSELFATHPPLEKRIAALEGKSLT